MLTLSSFIRPSDPIDAVDMATAISVAIGKTVTVEVTSTDILVTGDSLIAGDKASTQTAMTAYQYAYLQYGAPISDIFPMSGGRHDRGVTEAVALSGDLATRRKAYVSGVLKNDSFIYSSKATTNGSGVVTFYITSDGTAQGTAVFNNVYADSISVAVYGSTANYQPYLPTVSGDNKSITVTINQATTVLLGAIQLVSAASSIDCRLYVLGD